MAKSDYIKDRKTGKLLGRTGRGKSDIPEASKLTPSTLSTATSAINDTQETEEGKVWEALASIKVAVALGAKIPATEGTVLYKASVRFTEWDSDARPTKEDPNAWGSGQFENNIVLGFYTSEDSAYEVIAAYLLSNWKDEDWRKGTKGKYIRRLTGESLYKESEFSLWAEGKTPREIVEHYKAEHLYSWDSIKIEEIVVGQDVNEYSKTPVGD